MKHVGLETIGFALVYALGFFQGVLFKWAYLMMARNWKEVKSIWNERRSPR